MKSLIILPTYQEFTNLQILLPQIYNLNNSSNLFVYVIDDNSQDGTKEYINHLKIQGAKIKINCRPKKLGLGSAYMNGFDFASKNNFSIAITMDSDLSHDSDKIPELINGINNGSSLAIGSRYIKGGNIVGWPIHRKILSKGANFLSQKILDIPVKDCTSGFRAYSQKSYYHLLKQNFISDGYALLEEILFSLIKAGHSVVEIPITFKDRQHGKSKIGKREIIKGMMMLNKYYKLKKQL